MRDNIDYNKRYWYVEIAHYYPSGFLEDVEATCDTLEELKALHKERRSYEDILFWDSIKREYIEL